MRSANTHHMSCNDVCGSVGLVCLSAAEEVNDNCVVQHTLRCDQTDKGDGVTPTEDILCTCGPSGTSGSGTGMNFI